MKTVYFSEDEWGRVERGMARAGIGSISEYVRLMVLEGEVVVNERLFDVGVLRRLIAPIGNNINQIAHKANIEDFASVEQLELVRGLLGRIDETLREYALGGGERGSGQDWADQGDVKEGA